MSLEDIFDPQPEGSEAEQGSENGTEQAEQQVETESEAQAEETESETTSQPESEDEQDDSKETPVKTEDSEENIEKQDWTLAAVKDERRKRQELERKLEELQKEKSDKEIPDVFEDQSAFVDSIRQEYRDEIGKMRLELSRDMMIDTHDDYLQKEEVFKEMAKDNPNLVAEAEKQANPVKYLYEQAKKYEQFQQMQDVDSYKAKIKAELKAELEAEIKSAQEQQKSKVSDIKPSLAKARASDKDSFEAESLDSIFSK